MLYLIGLGINNELDISLRAVESMKTCSKVYCEMYTNKWLGNFSNLEHMAGKKINIIERLQVESDELIKEAKARNIALLVPGDPLTATTHMELIIQAKKNKVKTQIIHASSIFTAVGQCGLQLYKFGRTTTLVYPTEKFKPKSPYEIIAKNRQNGFHSLVLLDIHHEDEKYMTPREAMAILLDIENEEKKKLATPDTKIIVCCMLGDNGQIIKYGKIRELINNAKLDKTPAVIVMPGELNFKEEEALKLL